MASKLPKKKDVALALLEQASVFIHLDPRREGVVVPLGFKKQPQLVLQIGLNMAVKIPDLEVDDEGISCTLSFNRRPHYCHMPWAAIYALVDESGRGMVWPDDVPPEVVAQQREGAKKAAQRPKLRAVEGGGEERPASAPPGEARAAEARAERPALAAAEPAALEAEPEPAAPSGGEAAAPSAAEREPAAAEASGEQRPSAPPARSKSGKLAVTEGGKSGSAKSTRPPYLRLVK